MTARWHLRLSRRGRAQVRRTRPGTGPPSPCARAVACRQPGPGPARNRPAVAVRGCASLPPGSDFQKTTSNALDSPGTDPFGTPTGGGEGRASGDFRLQAARCRHRQLPAAHGNGGSGRADAGRPVFPHPERRYGPAADRGAAQGRRSGRAGSRAARRRGIVRARRADPDARGLPECRAAAVQSVRLSRRRGFRSRRRVHGRCIQAQLPDAQQALRRRQRDRHRRGAQRRGRILPGRSRFRIRGLRHHRGRPDRQPGLGQFRRLLEQPDGDSDRGACRRQAFSQGTRRLSRRSRRAPCTNDRSRRAVHARAGRRRAAQGDAERPDIPGMGEGGSDLRQSGKGEGPGRRAERAVAAASPQRSGEPAQVGVDHRVAVPGAGAGRDEILRSVARAECQRADTHQLAGVDRHVHRSLRLSGVSGAAARERRRSLRGASGARAADRPGQPAEIAELGAVRVARQGVRVRSRARVRRFDEPRPAVLLPQHGDRTDHRQSRSSRARLPCVSRISCSRPTATS